MKVPFLLLTACFVLVPALSYGAKGRPAQPLLESCHQILAGLDTSSKTDRVIAVMRKLILEKNAFPAGALEDFLNSPLPVNPLEFGYQNLKIEEAGALKQAMKVIFAPDQARSLDWEKIRKEVRSFSEQASKVARTRSDVEGATAPIFVPIFKETLHRADFIATTREGDPLFVQFREDVPDVMDRPDRYILVNPRTGFQSQPLNTGQEWDYVRLNDGTLFQYEHDYLGETEAVFLTDVFKQKKWSFKQKDELDLEDPGVSHAPSWHIYVNSRGHRSAAFWIGQKNMARLTLVDLELGTFEKYQYQLQDENELGNIFADGNGQVFAIKFKPEYLYIEKVGQPATNFRFPMKISREVLTKISHVFNAPNGKIFIFVVTAPNELTVINFTDGVKKTFTGVYSESGGFGWPKELSLSAEGKVYLTTYTQPYYGTGGTIYNLTDMSHRNFVFPSSVPNQEKSNISLHTVHLKNGTSYALAVLEETSVRLGKVIVNHLGDTSLVSEFPLRQFDLLSVKYIGATADGKGIEGFFDKGEGLQRIQLYGPAKK